MIDDDDMEISKRVIMRDKEAEELAALKLQSTAPVRVCRYRWKGDICESRIFDSIHHVPKGEGWRDTRAKPAPEPQIESVAAVSGLPAPYMPPELPPASAPRRGRKPKA
jgi:hypothetical protein